MTHRFAPAIVAAWTALALTGCQQAPRAVTMTTAPSNWSALEGQTVTLEGTSANSRTGPLLRFADRQVVYLTQMRPWSIDTVSRPVGITGRIVRGLGPQQDTFVVAVDQWWVQQSTNVPQPGTSR